MKNQGFTLLELLITVTIATIIAGYGIPGMAALVEKTRADGAAQAIYRGFQAARVKAVSTQQTLTICGSDDGKTCSREWRKYLLIFADGNDNKICEDEELVRLENLSFDDSRITTGLGLGRPYTRIKPDGSVSLQGSMTYCATRGSSASVRRITWNMVGRPYFGRDTDGDGVVNATNGDKINC